MKRFRLAFIGAGNRANLVHYPSFADLDNVEIVGVCDIDAQRLKNTVTNIMFRRTDAGRAACLSIARCWMK